MSNKTKEKQASAGGNKPRGRQFSPTPSSPSMPNCIAQNSPTSIATSESPDPELIPWKATGLTMAALVDLERRGILRLLRINQRVIMVDRNDWRAVPERLAAERRQAAALKQYGFVPGAAQ